MAMSDTICISGLWQRRPETPAEVAARVRRYMTTVRPSLPSDLKWWVYTDDDGTASFDPEAESDRLEAIIAGSADPEDDTCPPPNIGYRLVLYLASEDPCTKPARGAQLRLSAGAAGFQNSFSFDTDVYSANRADPRLTTYDALKANMMAAIWAFRPEWCTAAPNRLDEFLDAEVYARPFISLAWMVWIQASLAGMVKLPSRSWNLIIEPYSDGSLFMATGTRTVSCDDHDDLRQVRAIHRQLDHLNYLVPFEGMSGRNPRVPPFPKL